MRSHINRLSKYDKLVRSLVILFFLFGTGSPAAADGTTSLFMPVVFKGWDSGPGNITGKVSDAAIQDPATNGVGGAEVCYNTNCVLTDIHGGYTLTNVPAGFEIINSTKGSYEPQSSGVIVYGHETVTLNIAITQQLVINDIAIRFIVTWRTEPTWPPDGVENDLDSQLWMVIPPDIGNPRHIDPSNDLGSCEHYPDACVKRDTRTGSGPETVDIRLLHPKTTYYFGVLNYNASYPGVPPITQSLAKIQVYNQDGLMQSLNVPTRGTGDLWYAFMMDSSGTITPTNCITTMPPEYDPVNHPEDPMIPPQCPP